MDLLKSREENWNTKVQIKDGQQVLLRPMKNEDVGKWIAFYRSLSPESRYFRYFRYFNIASEPSSTLIKRCTTVDKKKGYALVAIIGFVGMLVVGCLPMIMIVEMNISIAIFIFVGVHMFMF